MPPTGPIIDRISLLPKQSSIVTLTPAQARELNPDQQFVIPGDRPLNVEASYEAANNGKYGVKFLDQTSIGQTGYIYAPHFEEIPQVLHAKRSIKLKSLTADVILFVGSRIILDSIDSGEIYCTLRLRHPIDGINEWRIYIKDLQDGCEVIGTEADNKPADIAPAAAKSGGRTIRVPGLSVAVYLENPISSAAPNFTWNEATHGGSRIPESAQVTRNIIRVAGALQEVRNKFGGRAMKVNSWYRPASVNRAAKGARYSRHIQGDGVDFVVEGIHPYEVYKQLNGWWGSRGGLASSSVFTHIDTRGSYARWSYGY